MPHKNRRGLYNRGRFQAQGDKLEKSKSWAQVNVPTKRDGYSFLDELKAELTPAELNARETSFVKARRWVDASPPNGYVVVNQIKTTFKTSPPVRDIRVDVELHSGIAFKN